MAKGVRSGGAGWQTWLGAGLALGALGLVFYRWKNKKKKTQSSHAERRN
jgi:LPXTG-motif cell wall-anchored protein